MKRIICLCCLLIPLGLFGQQTVRGTVTAEGEPLIGVSVIALGTSTGTITDVDGNYSITMPTGADTLEFSYVGYTSERIPLNGRAQIDVEMLAATALLEQVVVIGYGIQKKDDMTGAVGVIESKDITDIPTQSLGQALQGKVTGLQVIPASGAPGADAIFRIRGVGTLNNADPLFVVDGMIVNDISFINPQDVENVSVLKDASATSIYGARGANGVIIITTKKGGQGTGGVTVNAYTGSQEVVGTIDLVNAEQYATLINEADINEGRPPRFADPSQFTETTDWQDEVFRTAPIQNVQVGFVGGNDRSQFNVSANYFRQDGIIKGSDFERFSLRLNNQRKVLEWFSVGANVALVYNRSNNINSGSILLNAYRADPITPAVDEDGNFGNTAIFSSTGNPAATIFYNYNKSNSYRAVGNAFADISFLDHFTFRTNFGLDYTNSQNKSFVPVFEVSAIQQNEESRLGLSNAYNRNWLWENTLAYNNAWGVHSIDAVVGLTYQDNFGEFLSGSRLNLISEDPNFYYLNAGELLTSTVSNDVIGGSDWGLVSYLGRVNYVYDNRYLLTLAGRVDGSSRFGQDNRYGFFPSVGLGWNISNESFFRENAFLSRLKLRASWGRTGNDRIGDYSYTALITSGLGAVFGPNEDLNQGSSLLRLANPSIRWEETTQTDIGLEAGFFNNRLQLEADFYRRVTDGVLYAAEIPTYLGAAAPTRNISEILNQGLDLKLDWRHTIGTVRYGVGFLASFVDNEVLKVDGLGSDLFGGGLGIGGQLGTNSRAGFPIGAFYGFQVEGVFQNEAELEQFATLGSQVPGDLRFADINGDGVITADGDRVVLGSAIPDLVLGTNLFIEVAGFDFSLDITGQFGNEVINAKKMSRFGAYNFETSFLDRWTGEGTSNTEPRITFAGNNLERLSSRFVEDGSYIRLRNIQLGYQLPRSLLEKVGLRQLRFYISGTNLWTSQNYSGYNPEIFNGSVFDNGIDRGNIYPIARTVNFGVDAQF